MRYIAALTAMLAIPAMLASAPVAHAQKTTQPLFCKYSAATRHQAKLVPGERELFRSIEGVGYGSDVRGACRRANGKCKSALRRLKNRLREKDKTVAKRLQRAKCVQQDKGNNPDFRG